MKSIFWQFVVVCFICYSTFNSKGVHANQGPYANYPPPPPNQYQQQQEPYPSQQQQQQQQYSQPPPPYGAPPPPGYGMHPQDRGYDGRGPPGPPGAYGRPPVGQSDMGGGGLFSKLKSGILAAGSALTGGIEGGLGSSPQQQMQRRRPGGGGGHMGPPPPGYGGRGPPSGSFGPPQNRGIPGNDESGGLFGKFKNLFGSEEGSGLGGGGDRRHPGGGLPPPPPGYKHGSHYGGGGGQHSPSVYGQPGGSYPTQNPPSNPYSQSQPHMNPDSSQMGYPGNPNQPNPTHTGDITSSSAFGTTHPEQQSYPGHTMSDQTLPGGLSQQPYDPSQAPVYGTDSYQSGMDQYNIPAPPIPEPEALVAPEPQLLVVDDCVVLILKPREFFRKKMEIKKGGPSRLQVFTDFEHVVTKFKSGEGQRSLSSAELIEGSNAILPQAAAAIKALSDEYGSVSMDGQSFEELTARVQAIVAKEGGLHISSVVPVTRELSLNMPLRDGWKEAFQALSLKGVPTYVFSSGYGDVVAQSLLLNGISEEANSALPQNLRIISNFFRTAPDGTVRAFSQPVVHEKNKNATTASRHMGMPVPDRPNAVIFGSTLDDVMMTDGLDGISEKLSVGFIELTEDLDKCLPAFINSYDAVVLGDGSFNYIKSLLGDLLGMDANQLRKRRGMNLFERGLQDIF